MLLLLGPLEVLVLTLVLLLALKPVRCAWSSNVGQRLRLDFGILPRKADLDAELFIATDI